jgi:FtsH-binding integral membrane protein
MDPNKQYPQQPYPPGQYPAYPAGPGAAYPNPGYPNASGGYPSAGAGYPNAGYPNAAFGGYPQGPQAPMMGFQMPMRPEILVEQPKNDNVEGGGGYGMDFTEKTIRRGFIRKVYSILMVQLLVSVGFICLFMFHEGVKNWTRRNMWFYLVAMAGLFVMIIVMSCCSSVCRKSPSNYICLSIFTLFASLVLGAVSSTYQISAVLMAVGITTVICLSLTLFSFQTKIDFTRLNGFLFVCLIVLVCFGLIAMFFPHIPIIRKIYAALGALLFSVYLIHDTQLLMGGDHKYSISPEEYIFAALTLYLDIFNIFMSILSLVGNR